MAYKDREKYLAYRREYRKRPEVVAAMKAYMAKPGVRERAREATRRYVERNADSHRERARSYYAKNSKKVSRVSADAARKRRYGLTPADIQAMREQQGDKCPICCNGLGEGRSCCVDHCHKTGRVRQLLCSKCNSGLGMFKENLESMQRAIAYLERFNAGL